MLADKYMESVQFLSPNPYIYKSPFPDADRYVCGTRGGFNVGGFWCNDDGDARFLVQGLLSQNVHIAGNSLQTVSFPQVPSATYPNFYTSTTGIVWTARNISADGAGGFATVDGNVVGMSVANDIIFMARKLGGVAPKVYYSTTGDYWTQLTVPFQTTETPVTYPVQYLNGTYYIFTNGNTNNPNPSGKGAIWKSNSLAGPWTLSIPTFMTVSPLYLDSSAVWPERNILVALTREPNPTVLTPTIRYTNDGVTWYKTAVTTGGITSALLVFAGSSDGSKWIACPEYNSSYNVPYGS